MNEQAARHLCEFCWPKWVKAVDFDKTYGRPCCGRCLQHPGCKPTMPGFLWTDHYLKTRLA